MDEKAVVRLKKFLRSTRTRWIVKAHPMSVHFGHVDVTDEFLSGSSRTYGSTILGLRCMMCLGKSMRWLRMYRPST